MSCWVIERHPTIQRQVELLAGSRVVKCSKIEVDNTTYSDILFEDFKLSIKACFCRALRNAVFDSFELSLIQVGPVNA